VKELVFDQSDPSRLPISNRSCRLIPAAEPRGLSKIADQLIFPKPAAAAISDSISRLNPHVYYSIFFAIHLELFPFQSGGGIQSFEDKMMNFSVHFG
jgi:hypothetical protein